MESWKWRWATTDFIEQVDFLRKEIDKALKRLPLPEKPEYLYQPLKYMLNGRGKRLRPILVHLSGKAFNADPEDLMNAGVAVELLHNFTLVHDDIMDQDDLRHGQESVHSKWDEATAILAGDGIFVLAQLSLARISNGSTEAYRCFNRTALTVCEGQALDNEFESDPSISLDDYFDMIEKKTGSLLGLCAELGGILGNQDQETCARLKAYGTNMGKAFQIQDDLLEIFGDRKSMGKSLGSDVLSEKQTILTILAREMNDAVWNSVWMEAQGMKLDDRLELLRSHFRKSGVYEKALEMVKKSIVKARDGLNVFPEKSKAELAQFTDMILNREK